MTDSISFPYTVRHRLRFEATNQLQSDRPWAVMHEGVAVAFYSSEAMAIKAAARFTLTALEAKESN